MSRYIDADEFEDELYEHEFSNWCDKDEVSELIDNMPTADVVKVVRCKDCKYSEENCKSPIYGMWCKRFGAEKSNLAVLPTDYCSYGEKKEQDHE